MNTAKINPFRPKLLALSISALMAMPASVWANDSVPENKPEKDFIGMSLEDLLNIEVTSVMKTSTRLSDAAAAIFVLTSDDIRRTGATSIPEALRVVPGMHVARIDANKWAVTVRGFNGQFANKLLVLVDGRSVYTPLFSGVWWDQQDMMLEDIERIEVIRGPGASLWGSNAVNGVINIITKNSRDTQGTLVSAQAGNERTGGGARYGAKIGDDAYIKMYARHNEHDNSPNRDGSSESIDHARLDKFGFRYDQNLNTRDKLMLQGDVFDGYSGGAPLTLPNLSASLTPVMTAPYSSDIPTTQITNGHNVLGRWERALNNNSTMSLQIYWDSHERGPVADEVNVRQRLDTYDADFQHSFYLTEWQHIVWGGGYRSNHYDTRSSIILGFTPTQRTDNISSAFVQDEITLVPEHWKLTLGSKIEQNPSSSYELLPNTRLLWTPDDKHSFWGSVSRAVRTPNWVEQNVSYSLMTIPPNPPGSPLPVLLAATGTPEVKTEKMLAYELGWRGLLTPSISADAALFYFDYRDAMSNSPGNPQVVLTGTGAFVLQPVYFTNYAKINTSGGELAMNWQVTETWKLRANYSYFRSRFTLDSSATPETAIPFENAYPKQQAMLWSMHQLAPKIQLDMNLRYVDNLKIAQAPGEYVALDARLGWQPQKNMEVALVGRNMLNNGQVEFGIDQWAVATKNPREVFATVRLDF